MRVLRRADYKRMPWKNGRGLTEEVMACPKGCDVDSFDWRLSIAHVGADGPLSLFQGVDRTIALLDGSGLVLDLPPEADGRRIVELTQDGSTFSFPGEWEISGRSLGGPTIDLNIMTRCDRYSHEVYVMSLASQRRISPQHSTIIFAASPISVRQGAEEAVLQRFDAVLTDEHPDVVIAPGSDARNGTLYVIHLRPA